MITSFKTALRSVRMDVWKHWSFSIGRYTLLAESLRSFDLSRKIEGDSVRRVIDQILGSYLLSCMAFSVLIRSRSRDLSVARVVYFRFAWGVNKVTTRQTSHANDFVNKNTKSHAREKLLLAGYCCFSSLFHWNCHSITWLWNCQRTSAWEATISLIWFIHLSYLLSSFIMFWNGLIFVYFVRIKQDLIHWMEFWFF